MIKHFDISKAFLPTGFLAGGFFVVLTLGYVNFAWALSETNVPATGNNKSTEALRIENLNKPRVFLNIPYTEIKAGQTANTLQTLDIYLPAATNTAQAIQLKTSQTKTARKPAKPASAIAPRKRTAILFIHGGSFTKGNKEQFSAYCNLFAKSGFVSATMNYRLSPASPYPAAFNDVKSAVKWLQSHADQYKFDPKRIVVVGYSAGGNLALLMGLDKGSTNKDNPVASKAQSLLSQSEAELLPLEDLLPRETFTRTTDTKAAAAPAVNTKPAVANAKPAIEKKTVPATGKGVAVQKPSAIASQPSQPFVAGVVSLSAASDLGTITRIPQLRQDIQRYLADTDPKAASPLYQVKAKAPPMLLIHGENDQLVPLSQSRQMLEALHSARIPALLRAYPGVGHEIIYPNPQLGRILRELTEFFLYIERRRIASPAQQNAQHA